MQTSLNRSLRLVLVGTGTGVGKTHVGCALVACWSSDGRRAVGLKPVETGVEVDAIRGSSRSPRRSGNTSDQQRLAAASRLFHVKHKPPRSRRGRIRADRGLDQIRSLYAFSEPISPHLAARDARVRIDIGNIERWVEERAATITVIETAGGLFSPLGHGTSNFDLMQALRPQAVILVAPDRLGVLHELTTTLALAAARGGPQMGVVLSAPAAKDASTGRNAAELATLGITRPIGTFPRAPVFAPSTADAARRVIDWIERRAPSPRTER